MSGGEVPAYFVSREKKSNLSWQKTQLQFRHFVEEVKGERGNSLQWSSGVF